MDTQIISSKPIKIDPRSIKDLKRKYGSYKILDTYQDQIKELFLIRNPRYRFENYSQSQLNQFIKRHKKGQDWHMFGNWFYFPWNNTLVHYLPQKLHQELRTARNKNLITEEEQNKLFNFKVGVAGLSVGSHAVSTIVMMGMANNIKIADGDSISGSNLNRIRLDFTMIGMKKCDFISHFIYQVNPYANIEVYQDGINASNLKGFLNKPFKLDVLVDELDNLEMKIRMRLEARKLRIPVIMATDNGDNVIVDVERYDQSKAIKLFNGVIDENDFKNFQQISPKELPRLALQIAGRDFAVAPVLESLLEVGKSLYSWPQLGSAATLSGVAIAYVVKRLALKQPLNSGKYEVNLDAIFIPDFFSTSSINKRNTERNVILKKLGA